MVRSVQERQARLRLLTGDVRSKGLRVLRWTSPKNEECTMCMHANPCGGYGIDWQDAIVEAVCHFDIGTPAVPGTHIWTYYFKKVKCGKF